MASFSLVDFENLPEDFFDDNFIEEPSVASSIVERASQKAKTFKLDDILPGLLLLDTSMMDYLRDLKQETSEHPPKKLRVATGKEDAIPSSFQLKQNMALSGAESQFGDCITDGNKLAVINKGFVLSGTMDNTAWALRNFQAWREWRKLKNPEEPVPEDFFAKSEPEALNKWLSLYAIETRRKDGKPFPTRTIECLLAGLKWHMKEMNPYAPNFLDENDPCFARLRGTRDSISQ